MRKLAIVALLVAAAGIARAEYGPGDGSATTPFEISTLGHWQTLMNSCGDWDKHFKLTANLDFQGMQLTPVGNQSTRFTGVFDGQRFVIRNVAINLPDESSVGLFGCVGAPGSDTCIKNLGVEDIVVTGETSVGGLVGNLEGGTISACYVTGTISGEGPVGGLCGCTNEWSRVSTCYTSADVQATVNIAGGLAGMGGNIGNSYATGTVSGQWGVGQLVGQNFLELTSCYAAGSAVCSNWPSGGLVGYLDLQGGCPNCFWDVEAAATIWRGAGTGLPTSAMQDVESYLRAYWDFVGEVKNGTDDIWYMPPEGGYPVLAWQVADLFILANDEMAGAVAIAAETPVTGSTVGATGLDITRNGYNDCLDIWYAFDCASAGKYTITLEGSDFDATLGVFDEAQREIVFNDEFFGGKSQVVLNGKAGRRYYIRVAGSDAQAGSVTLKISTGATQAIQGDLNYDGLVNLVDFAAMADSWLAEIDD